MARMVYLGSFFFSSPSAIWLTKYNQKLDLPMEKLLEKGWEWSLIHSNQ